LSGCYDPAVTIEQRVRRRRSLAEEDRDLARQVGMRLKAARTQARMTQRELAEPRYTKAYISALEKGLIKPSLAALRYLARRLGTVPEAFLADPDTQWQRIDAELRLAAGDWQSAADRFRAILETEIEGAGRGLSLLGLAEASYRLGQGRETIGLAAEARQLLVAANRPAEARRAAYWLAAGHHATDDPARARMLYEELLAQLGSEADPELRVRVLIALATVVTNGGEPLTAIALLEEARSLGADLDDRRRATLLHSLAQSYRMSGDFEGAVRTGIESVALFRAIDARAEVGLTENELALSYLAIDHLRDAERHARAARVQLERDGDPFRMTHLADTEARIALARGDLDEAAASAELAARLAQASGNSKGLVDALLTVARTARRRADRVAAVSALQRAAETAADGPPARLRAVLTEWSEVAAETGDHATAYELTRRALALG
jgi:transcriptional regulator with XRE-family HTH domain